MIQIKVTSSGSKIFDQSKTAIAKLDELTQRELYNLARNLTSNIKKQILATNFSSPRGKLLNSVRWKKVGKRRRYDITMAYYGWYVNQGRKPGKKPIRAGASGFVPIRPIGSWANSLGLNPLAIAYSIGRKGTKGKFFLQKAFFTNKRLFKHNTQILLNKINKAFN